jgi:hypothetical protein
LDGESVLAEGTYAWEFGKSYLMKLAVQKNQIQAWVDGTLLFRVEDPLDWLSGGGIGLVCEEGRIGTDRVSVSP